MTQIAPEITEEIDRFAQAVDDYLSEKISESKFQRIRLQHGVYGQRQDGVQMIRIKLPFGEVTADQFDRIADICTQYSRGIAHITTRQDLQIHYVDVKNVPDLMRQLAEVGITTREACGNTVRNVTASPYAGVAATEPFDVTPYAQAFFKHFLRNPICQNMGRKFKVAFEGSDEDHARLEIHDIGFQAKIQDGQKGFKVFIAGGLGATPFIAETWSEFIPVEEMIPFSEAVLRVFDRHGERKVRSKARMKFIVRKFGFEKFREMVEEERTSLKVDPAWNNYLTEIDDNWEQPTHSPQGKPVEPSAEFEEWKKTNVQPQRQEGYSIVDIRLVVGDMVPDQMHKLADITRRYANSRIRMTIEQNMVLRWIHNDDLPALYEELKAIDMVLPNALTVYDVTACPGTDTCRLGIAGSMPLAKTLSEKLQAANGTVSKHADDLHIKISGCPNSCGQHHLGNIGFHGGALPQEGHVAPAFQLMIGGGIGPNGTAIAQIITKIPSKKVPDATIRMIEHFDANKNNGESFNDFYQRLGKEKTIELLADLQEVPDYNDDPDFYTDWGDDKEFGLQQGVIGECAGSPVSDVTPQLSDAEPLLEQARALATHGEHESARTMAYQAIAKIADAMLYKKMVQTFNARESIFAFNNHFIKTGEITELGDFESTIQGLMQQDASESNVTDILEQAEQMLKVCQ